MAQTQMTALQQETFHSKARKAPISYTVKSGDSWFSIAQKLYGGVFDDPAQAARMAQALARANGDVSTLRAGMVLKAPRAQANPYVSQGFMDNAGAPGSPAQAAPVKPAVQPALQSAAITPAAPTWNGGGTYAPGAGFTAPAPLAPVITALPDTQNKFTYSPPAPAPLYGPAGFTANKLYQQQMVSGGEGGTPSVTTTLPDTQAGQASALPWSGGGTYQPGAGFSAPKPPANTAPPTVGVFGLSQPGLGLLQPTPGVQMHSSIIPYLLQQGIYPLVFYGYDQAKMGITDAELSAAGYKRDKWGTWIRQSPTAGRKPQAATGGYSGGYSGGGRGGGGGGGGGTPRSINGYAPAASRGYDPSLLGLISWRI